MTAAIKAVVKKRVDGRFCLIPLESRFWSHVDKFGPIPKLYPELGSCWVWTGFKMFGYGYVFSSRSEKKLRAHRVSWMLVHGAIEKGLCVLHRCDNPPCVRPDHLFLGTHSDNRADAVRKGRVAVGERHGMSKLDNAKVSEIRSMYPDYSQRKLAKQYGVSQRTIWNIVNDAGWNGASA